MLTNTQNFHEAIEAKNNLMLYQIFKKHDVLSEDDEFKYIDSFRTVHDIGLKNPFSNLIANYLKDSPLYGDYISGAQGREHLKDNPDVYYGSLDEFKTLSKEQQEIEWETFHELCQEGTADEMYFYDVMMKMHLDGYVGH